MEKEEKRKKFLEEIRFDEDSKIIYDKRDRKQDESKERRSKQRNRRVIGTSLVGAATAIGITAGAMSHGTKEPNPLILDKKTAIEMQNIDDVQKQPRLIEIEQEIERLEKEDNFDVLRFLKNEYIEKYEQKMGMSKLTTDNIIFRESYQDYVYVDHNTGDFITHGNQPYETQNMLEKQGISYDIKKNIKVYEVIYQENGQESIIDCMALKGIPDENGINQKVPIKVTIGSSQYRPYESVLTEMGIVIEKGIEYAKNIENDEVSKEMTKSAFIEAYRQWKEKEEQNFIVQKDEGYEIGD